MGKYKKSSVSFLTSEFDAAETWSNHFRGVSEKTEYAAFIYSIFIGGNKVYFLGRTFKGMGKVGFIRANVAAPFVYLYLIETAIQWFKYRAKVEAFIHTHPKPPPGCTCISHSREDSLILYLPMIKAVYVIPFENKEINRKPDFGAPHQ